MMLDLASGVATRATASASAAELSPAWTAKGELTISSLAPDGGGATVSIDAAGDVSMLSESGGAVDLPLAWSPDGKTLAARTITGGPNAPGPSYIELIETDGVRARASDSPDALIVGWLK
jgi:hypothetical protein